MAQSDKYLFNNTAIGLVGVLATLQNCEQMDIANTMLINPFLLHSETLAFLTKPVKLRGVEEFLGKFPKTFVNFPERYKSLLTMSFNCLVIGVESGMLQLDDDVIYPTPKLKQYNFPKQQKLGNRANHIVKAAGKLSRLLQTESFALYLNLRIEL